MLDHLKLAASGQAKHRTSSTRVLMKMCSLQQHGGLATIQLSKTPYVDAPMQLAFTTWCHGNLAIPVTATLHHLQETACNHCY